jgi:adenine-specific DNA-methyltransferase
MPILQWLNRDKHTRTTEQVPYRLLEQQDEYSFGDVSTSNMLIQGDNLDALKALLPYYAGRVKCIFIDPPYNTRSAFEHYDDNLEHSQWLGMMYPRLELLRDLLAEDGSIWVTIDDNEAHYLKVIMDEVFGRKNFIQNCIWQKKFSPQNDAKYISDQHDHILVFTRNKEAFKIKKIFGQERIDRSKNPDNDPRGVWKSVDYTCNKNKVERPNLYYQIIQPNTGAVILPKETAVWRFSEERHAQNDRDGLVYWGKNGTNSVPRYKKFEGQEPIGGVPTSLWFHQDVGNTQEARKESLKFNDNDPFSTPKPERLIKRIIDIATNPGDLVLDSFLGSGTTAAVTHKMGRRYIGIEMGDHAVTHCVPRLKKVIEGEQGGISEAVGWKGGGGFRFYQLGSAVFDGEGRINPQIHFAHLAAHIWFSETRTALRGEARSPYLGTYNGTAYYLLYNGILGDKRPNGGNVLTSKVLSYLSSLDGPKVIYGETSRLGQARLKALNIIFKQTPYDVKVG